MAVCCNNDCTDARPSKMMMMCITWNSQLQENRIGTSAFHAGGRLGTKSRKIPSSAYQGMPSSPYWYYQGEGTIDVSELEEME